MLGELAAKVGNQELMMEKEWRQGEWDQFCSHAEKEWKDFGNQQTDRMDP